MGGQEILVRFCPGNAPWPDNGGVEAPYASDDVPGMACEGSMVPPSWDEALERLGRGATVDGHASQSNGQTTLSP